MSKIRELRAKFTASAKGFTSSIKQIAQEAGKMGDETEESTQQADNGFQKLKKTIAGFAGAYLGFQAVQGAVTKLGGALNDFQSGLSGLQAQTGATDEEMKGMETSLKNIYKGNYGEDFTDIANAMALVKNATGLSGKELENTTKNALMLRDTFEWDVAESTKTADTMMKQFGITSEEAFTLLAQGTQNGLDKSGDMLDSFNEYSVYFKQLGFDAEGMWDVFKAGADSGAFNIDKVGDSIKEFGIRVKDGSKTSRMALDDLGLDLQTIEDDFAQGGETAQKALQTVFQKLGEIEDPLQRNSIGVALFGTQFEDMEQKTILALGNVDKKADQSADTLEKIDAVKYNNIGKALQGVGRLFMVEIIGPLQSAVMPAINRFIQYIKENMPSIKSAIQGAFSVMGEIFKKVIPIGENLFTIFKNVAGVLAGPLAIAIGIFKGAILPVVGVITDIVAKFTEWEGFAPLIIGIATALGVYKSGMIATMIVMKTITTATKIWAGAQKLLNLVMSLNPIGIVIALIVGLIAMIVLAYQKSETFRNIVDAVWNGIKATVSAVIAWFMTTIPVWIENTKAFFVGLWTKITEIFNGIKTTMTTIWNAIVAFIVPIVAKFVSMVVAKAKQMQTNIMKFISPLIDFFKNTWNNIKLMVLSIIGVFLNLITGNFQGLKISLLGIWTAIKNQTINVITTLKKMALNIFNAIKAGITLYITTVKTVAVKIFTTMKNLVISIVKGLYTGTINLFKNLYNGARNKVTDIKNAISNGFKNAKQLAIDAFVGMVTGVANKITDMKNKVSDMKDSIIDKISGINLKSIGSDIIQGLINGISGKITALKDKAKEVANAVTGKIKGLLDIHSPSRVMMELGGFAGEGLGLGIEKMKGFVENATGELVDASVGRINGEVSKPVGDLDIETKDPGTGGTGGGGGPIMHVENQYVNDPNDGREIGITLYNRQRNADRKKGR